jgi:hypothetical protein
MKRSLFSLALLFVLFLSNNSWSQYEFIVNLTSPFTYFAGTSEPDRDWYRPDFDDSAWMPDTGTIGFGYDGFEDVLLPEGTLSVYLRYRFNIENKADFCEGNFFADYDDGYIAWLNGKEIVRVNVNKSLAHPAYDDLTVRSHAIQQYGWDPYPILGYFLDSLQLDSSIVVGENILAVHVLNDSIDGSDLQFRLKLFNITHTDYNYIDWPSMYKKQVDLDSTDFPIVIVETDEWGIPYKNIRRKAFMGIIDKGPGQFNRPVDSCNVYYGDVSIEVRGKTSADFPKRSYRLEFIDSLGNDSSVSVLGMPSESDWILYGPFSDKAQFRNTMVYDMGRWLNGSYQPRDRFCEFIMNGEFLGLYSLTETIKRDADRVNISKLTPDEISGVQLTGGYILAYDWPYGWLWIIYPNERNLQLQQEEYIMGFMNEYKAVLYSNGFLDPDSGYRKYINDTSLVDHIIVNEIIKNTDAYLASTFLSKDRDDKDGRLHFGPLWDYDRVFGNVSYRESNFTYGWQFDYEENKALNILRLFQDESLVDLFRERYQASREGCFSNEKLFYYIDSIVNYLEEPVGRNYKVWPVIDEPLSVPANYISQSYEEEIWNIKNWLTDRLEWMDANIDEIYYPVIIYTGIPSEKGEGITSFSVFPNPFSEALGISITIQKSAVIRIEITDLLGRRQLVDNRMLPSGFSELVLDNNGISQLSPGIYMMRISIDNRMVGVQRLVKQ